MLNSFHPLWNNNRIYFNPFIGGKGKADINPVIKWCIHFLFCYTFFSVLFFVSFEILRCLSVAHCRVLAECLLAAMVAVGGSALCGTLF